MVTLIVVLLSGCASWPFEPRENTSCTQKDVVGDIEGHETYVELDDSSNELTEFIRVPGARTFKSGNKFICTQNGIWQKVTSKSDYVEDIVVTVSAPYLHPAIGLCVLVEKDGYTIVECKSVPNLRTIDNVTYFPENCNQPLDIKTLGLGRVEKGAAEIVACADGV